MKKTLVILGHPDKKSFCGALADAYVSGALKTTEEVRYHRLGDLQFDPVLRHGYNEIQELEPNLQKAMEDILWARHLVFVYPT